MGIKENINRDNRICFILNQAAEECCLPPLCFCISMTVIDSILCSVVAGGVHLGGGHTINVTAYVPEDRAWTGEIEVVLDADEQHLQRVKISKLIDVIQGWKDALNVHIQ